MKLLLDECCDASLVANLRAEGHDVLYVAETMPSVVDEDVLRRALAEERILITEDKDFGELVYRLRLPARGIVLLRFEIGDENVKSHRLTELLSVDGRRLAGFFVVVESDKTRFRPLHNQ